MRYKHYLPLLVLLSGLASCKNGADSSGVSDTAKTDGHPAWIMQGNIYEVNVRQYTPEGTFKALNIAIKSIFHAINDTMNQCCHHSGNG